MLFVPCPCAIDNDTASNSAENTHTITTIDLFMETSLVLFMSEFPAQMKQHQSIKLF
jgi:hypothetical protein